MSSPAGGLDQSRMEDNTLSFRVLVVDQDATRVLDSSAEGTKSSLERNYKNFFDHIGDYLHDTHALQYQSLNNAVIHAKMQILYINDPQNNFLGSVYAISNRILDLTKVASLPTPLNIQPESINGIPLEELTFPPDHEDELLVPPDQDDAEVSLYSCFKTVAACLCGQLKRISRCSK